MRVQRNQASVVTYLFQQQEDLALQGLHLSQQSDDSDVAKERLVLCSIQKHHILSNLL